MHREKTALCCRERSPLCSLCLRCPASAHFPLEWYEIESDGPTLLPWPSTDKEFSLIGKTSLIEDVEYSSRPTFSHYLSNWLQRGQRRPKERLKASLKILWRSNRLRGGWWTRRGKTVRVCIHMCISIMSTPERSRCPDCTSSLSWLNSSKSD